MFQLLKTFLKDNKAVSMIEFAFVLPILILLFFGIVDVSRYYQFYQKLDNANYTMANLVNQNLQISLNDIDIYYKIIPILLEPFETDDLQVIVTDVERKLGSNVTRIRWQVNKGLTSNKSSIGSSPGQSVSIKDMPLEEGDQIIVTEIFLKFKFLFNTKQFSSMIGFDGAPIHRVFYSRPRYATFEFDPT